MENNLKITLAATTVILLIIIITATYLDATETPEYIPLRFFMQEVVDSSSGSSSIVLPGDIASALKPLPPSFEMSVRFGGEDDWDVHCWVLYTTLREGEVIQFGYNSTYPVALYTTTNLIDRINGTLVYGTAKVPCDGLYCFVFDFQDPAPVVRARVSFMCYEAVNTAAITTPWYHEISVSS